SPRTGRTSSARSCRCRTMCSTTSRNWPRSTQGPRGNWGWHDKEPRHLQGSRGSAREGANREAHRRFHGPEGLFPDHRYRVVLPHHCLDSLRHLLPRVRGTGAAVPHGVRDLRYPRHRGLGGIVFHPRYRLPFRQRPERRELMPVRIEHEARHHRMRREGEPPLGVSAVRLERAGVDGQFRLVTVRELYDARYVEVTHDGNLPVVPFPAQVAHGGVTGVLDAPAHEAVAHGEAVGLVANLNVRVSNS